MDDLLLPIVGVDSRPAPCHNLYAHSAMSMPQYKAALFKKDVEEKWSAPVLEHACAPNHHHLQGGNDG
jgi:hypothetical protein